MDSTTIATIAFQCPLKGGNAVYKARSLYLNYQPLAYFSNLGLGIYPNPTTGVLTIEHAAAGTLVITNITGSQVARYDTKAGKDNITLPAAIPSGIYLLRFTDITTGKVTNARLLYKP